MAKRLSPQEMMAKRNPLNRTAVAPIDIYNQSPDPVRETSETKPQQEVKNVQNTAPKITEKKAKSTVKASAKQEESDSPYSTYLFKHQVKGIKLRAIEQDVKDKHIVQQAIDEYFKNHPL